MVVMVVVVVAVAVVVVVMWNWGVAAGHLPLLGWVSIEHFCPVGFDPSIALLSCELVGLQQPPLPRSASWRVDPFTSVVGVVVLFPDGFPEGVVYAWRDVLVGLLEGLFIPYLASLFLCLCV